jgi:Uma2 family endonuclease
MNTVTHPPLLRATGWPVLPADTPIIYEDEEDEANDMGEANQHYRTNNTLFNCVKAHMRKRRRKLRVYANMNCCYAPGPLEPETGSLPYFSSDVMVVEPFESLPEDLVSYTIGRQGSSPLSAMEVLSKGNAETNDKQVKVILYARLKIDEYILIDPTGKLLEQKLLLKQLQPDGTWLDFQDDDGGGDEQAGFPPDVS